MNYDGTNNYEVTSTSSTERYPRWITDNKIIFQRSPGGNLDADVFTINLDGTNEIQVISASTHYACPTWKRQN